MAGKIGLSPTIKQLLTLRNPHPLPSPPFSHLSRVLARTFNDAKEKKAETGWLVLTVSFLFGHFLHACVFRGWCLFHST
jgi:hypothetical protein